MFIAIPKSTMKQADKLPAFVYDAKYIIAQSKGQARRAIFQADCKPEDFIIFEEVA